MPTSTCSRAGVRPVAGVSVVARCSSADKITHANAVLHAIGFGTCAVVVALLLTRAHPGLARVRQRVLIPIVADGSVLSGWIRAPPRRRVDPSCNVARILRRA